MGFLPFWLNPFDFLIGFAMIAGVALGFVRGLLRMLFSIIILYIATVLSMSFYIKVGDYIKRMIPTTSKSASQSVAFLLILILSAVILHFLFSRTYKDTEWPGIRQIDQLGGLIFGFLVSALWIGLALIGIDFILSTPALGGEVVLGGMKSYFRASNLIPIFYKFLPFAFATLTPWVPKGRLPEIFSLKPF